MSPQETDLLSELVSAMHQTERRSDKRRMEVCERPEIGELVEILGYDFLIQTLELEQRIFAAEYPTIAFVSEGARQAIKEIVKDHLERCPRCRWEAEKERRWRKEFAQFLKTEKEVVRKILKEKSRPADNPQTFVATAGS